VYVTDLPHIPKEIEMQLVEDSRILKANSEKIYTIINDPDLLRRMREGEGEYESLIRQCLQAIINLEDAVYPTRPRVDLDKNGFEFRSGDTGMISSIDRF
jgi:hypothetical protein